MHLTLDSAQLFIPDNQPLPHALSRTTHLAIGAHQDDLEIMAIDGILTCFQDAGKYFSGVVVTNGRGAPRAGQYQAYTDDELWAVRNKEQRKAAVVGEFAALALLDYASGAVKDGDDARPLADIVRILRATRPEVVYTHNLADKHATHVAVALRVIAALRSLPEAERPQHVYGCEVWRDLDWMVDVDKIAFDCSAHENLQAALIGVFDSQIAGGKRYDLATLGRRRTHATYYASHAADIASGMTFAMDLTPLITDPHRDIGAYVQGHIARFAQSVQDHINGLRLSAHVITQNL